MLSPVSLHDSPSGSVIFSVTRFVVSLCLAVPALAAGIDTPALLKAVETRYNRAGSIQVLFQQTYRVQGRQPRAESGELFLRKPGRMRWQYDSPPGKLFLSDGKLLYLYNPASNRVERMKVRESDDLRAPLGFLLGRLDFWDQFRQFTSSPDGANVRITAEPKSDRAPYTTVEFLVSPAHEISFLRITGQDQSVMEFRFAREKLNPPLADSLFQFAPPPGAEVVEGISEEEGGP